MSTNNILFINHSEKACGVQQYGKRVAQIFKASKKYNVIYAEPTCSNELCGLIQILKPKATIYNYLPETMPWLNPMIIEKIRASGYTIQGLIVHNVGYQNWFDFYLHQNPHYPQNGRNYSLLRPLFNSNRLAPFIFKPTIGTFGFGSKVKHYDDICGLVNEQFDEAEINMHLTVSHFRPNHEELIEVKSQCRSRIKKPGITLNFTSDFKDDEEILDFLNGNSVNVFLYNYYPNYNGISSVIDYALSVRRPIAVCKSNMFAHINNVFPSICIEDRTLPEIIDNGIESISRFRDLWSNANFVKHLEGVIDSL